MATGGICKARLHNTSEAAQPLCSTYGYSRACYLYKYTSGVNMRGHDRTLLKKGDGRRGSPHVKCLSSLLADCSMICRC
jgi:hypothetical protein